MQKIYSLLRNNKQTGPYTLKELADLSLKQHDLIWVEGKSGGWSYPSEIEALKPYLNEPQSLEKTKEPTQQAIEALKTSLAIEVKERPQEPASVKHIYISFPAGGSTSKPANGISPSMSEEESPEAKLERKAQELRNKIQAFADGKSQPKADNELDIKYARSLDEIKEEYSDWMHHQKGKKILPYKKIAAGVLGVCFILFVGYIIDGKFYTPKTGAKEDLVMQEKVLAASVSPLIIEEEHGKKVSIQKPTHKKQSLESTSSAISKKPAIPKNKIDDYIDSLNRTQATTNDNYEDYTENNHEELVVEQQKNNPVLNKPSKENQSRKASTKESSASFAQLVQLSESTGSEGSKLTIYNNSDRFLNFVAVDVYYYKGDKLLQRKTLYFNNISPQSSSPLYIPEIKKPASVKCQLGLISTEGGLYYAKQ